MSIITVIKLGSSVFKKIDDISKATCDVYHYLRQGHKAVVVVSAIRDSTNQLLQQYENASGNTRGNAVAAVLLSTGEVSAATLFTAALQRIGVSTAFIQHPPIIASSDYFNAKPITVDKTNLYPALEHHDVVVIPGFIAKNDNNETVLLGRGGSDLTALFLAHELRANQCLLIKDVDGIYQQDPNQQSTAKAYQQLNIDEAIALNSNIVQPKALVFAKQYRIPFQVGCVGNHQYTTVSSVRTTLRQSTPHRPLRIGLLGLGTVGYGVYQKLIALPHLFEVVGIAIQHEHKHLTKQVNKKLLTSDVQRVINGNCDVIIELIGGIFPAYSLIKQALSRQKHVITANKALIADYGHELENLACHHQVKLFYSAAVAGGIPVLEILDSLPANKSIKKISGVLNGTTNYILNQLLRGVSYANAVKKAQQAGFAEADPSLDVNGQDAAQKICLLSRKIFNRKPDSLDIIGIDQLSKHSIQTAIQQKKSIRLIASCEIKHNRLHANIIPKIVEHNHPFSQLEDAQNCILIECQDGEIIQLNGSGAGRWPTTESVIADLIALKNLPASNRKQAEYTLEQVA